MRWFWIDRFDEFVRGRRATAVKNVSLAEEHLHDHFPGAALMPNSLIVEGMAQTAGLLVADAIDFNRRVVLAKVAAAEFHFDAVPGDSIRFAAEVLDLKPTGSTSLCGASGPPRSRTCRWRRSTSTTIFPGRP